MLLYTACMVEIEYPLRALNVTCIAMVMRYMYLTVRLVYLCIVNETFI